MSACYLDGSLALIMTCAAGPACRPHDMRSLHLIGVTLLLPQLELDYFRAFAQNSNYFVVEMSGTAAVASVPGVLGCAASVCLL